MTRHAELFDGGLETVGLEIHGSSWETEGAVWEAIRSVPDGRGWVCLGQEVVEWPGAATGRMMSAEIAGSDGSTLHVRRSDGGWRGWRYREVPAGDLVRFREVFVGTVPDSERRLTYAVYWRREREQDEVEVLRPYAARFTGWEGA